MAQKRVVAKMVHRAPLDVQEMLASKQGIQTLWEDLTPLARNEWICWITSAKKNETRSRRMRIMSENLLKGKRRPCCWAGCPHR